MADRLRNATVDAKIEENPMQTTVNTTDTESNGVGFGSRRARRDRVVLPPTLPELRRQGIRWSGGVNGDDLVIELEFENPAPDRTRASSAIVHIAEFGAFVPWRPLTVIRVPPIPPGGRRTVVTAVDPEDPNDLAIPGFGKRDALVPRRLARGGLRGLFACLFGEAHDVTALQVHFVGNLNVFVPGSQPVERHVNRTIKLDPKKHNLAWFVVGDGARDTYTFTPESDPPGWSTEIQGVEWNEPVAIARSSFGVSMQAPAGATWGRVTIWVERASTAQRVPVEFELAANPDAADCYRL